jgi:hypothetical protein
MRLFPRPAVDLVEAARLANVSKVDVLRAARAGLIKITIKQADLDAWVAKGRPQGRRGRRWKPHP